MAQLSKNQIDILLHAVGNSNNSTRNYFACSEDCPDWKDVEILISHGLMEKAVKPSWTPYTYFRVTQEGFKFLKINFSTKDNTNV